MSLNGLWDFTVDMDPKYHARNGGFYNPQASRRYWLKVQVPNVWQKYAERYDIYEGVCWFAKEFHVDNLPSGYKAKLRFGGVNYFCNIYINGVHAGCHEGGYTEFTIDVTGKLKEGENHISVQVDNRASITKWPAVIGYFNYGGIHRNVSLELTDGPVLEQVKLDSPRRGQDWQLSVSGHIDCACRGLTVLVSGRRNIHAKCTVDKDGGFSCEMPFPDVIPWSPEIPHLEKISVKLLNEKGTLLDCQDFDYGFRSIAVRNAKVELNGNPYQFNGICYVYDSPTSGLLMEQEQIETDLGLMKEMGCNAVRCHYPMSQEFYESCDRLGLLIWIEPPVYCYHPGDQETGTRFADAEWLALAQKMAIEMIAVAKNHPSVAIYSIGNECNTQNPEAAGFFRTLATTIRKEDSTRLISYAALYGNIGALPDIVDILGINSYYGWYDQIRQDGSDICTTVEGSVARPINLEPMHKMLDKVLAEKTDMALFLTEFGADAVPGYHSRSRELWSEDYHAALLGEILALAKKYPEIAGTFPFCFSDYRDPSKIINGYWNGLNLKGAVDYQRNRKLAFHAMSRIYNRN